MMHFPPSKEALRKTVLILALHLISVSATATSSLEPINVPSFDDTPSEIEALCNRTLETANSLLQSVSAGPSDQGRTFETTVMPIDLALDRLNQARSKFMIISLSSSDPASRAMAGQSFLRVEQAIEECFQRPELYRAVRLVPEPIAGSAEVSLLRHFLLRFRQNGAGLGNTTIDRLKRIKTELLMLELQFKSNLAASDQTLIFAVDELAGVPEAALAAMPRSSKGEIELRTSVNRNELALIVTRASRSSIRMRVWSALQSAAKEANLPVLSEIIRHRAEHARLIGYASHRDAVSEPLLLKDPGTFLDNLSSITSERWETEKTALTRLKRQESGAPEARLDAWDFEYFRHIRLGQSSGTDPNSFRRYFPQEHVVERMLRLYGKVFGLEFNEMRVPRLWSEEIRVFQVSDSVTHEVLGVQLMDLLARPGKYPEAANLEIIGARRNPDGSRRAPVNLLTMALPRGEGAISAHLSLDEVSTLFHEFGHSLHILLSRAPYYSLSGIKVPQDFVEAPSQTLELWLRDPRVLSQIARSPDASSVPVPSEVTQRILGSDRDSSLGAFRMQIALSKIDQLLHSAAFPIDPMEMIAQSNAIIEQEFLPVPHDSALVSGFFHMINGYAATYYTYPFTRVIAADFSDRLRQSPNGPDDPVTGGFLRREILEQGASRDISESIRAFLGRDWDDRAFRRGIEAP